MEKIQSFPQTILKQPEIHMKEKEGRKEEREGGDLDKDNTGKI